MPTVSKALTEAAERDPDLAEYYEFQRALFDVHEQARNQIAARLELADPAALKERLSQGLPLLAFAQLPVRAEPFARLGVALAQALMSYYPDLDGQALPATATEWMALAEQRFQENQAGQTGESTPPALDEMATDLALRPYLEWAAEQVWPHVDAEAWKRAYCPACGGAPDFALLEEETGARHLVCSRCNSQWRYQRLGCPFCDTQDYRQIVYYPSDDEVYRLYVCHACKRYLKTMDLRRAGGRPVLVQAERITTVTLDAAARQEGHF
jgi:FdhE protein